MKKIQRKWMFDECLEIRWKTALFCILNFSCKNHFVWKVISSIRHILLLQPVKTLLFWHFADLIRYFWKSFSVNLVPRVLSGRRVGEKLEWGCHRPRLLWAINKGVVLYWVIASPYFTYLFNIWFSTVIWFH